MTVTDRRTVRDSHTATYADPIRVTKGDTVFLTGREEVWDGHRWLWAVADDGREGWIPDDLVVQVDGRTVAARDFSALELTCQAGETVEVVRQTHGWAWCRKGDGGEGWVPLRELSQP